MRRLLFCLLLSAVASLPAQQLADWMLINKSTFYYNPAVAGTKEYVEFILQTKQKLNGGLKGPSSVHLSGHAPVYFGKIGVGGQCNLEQFGQGNYANLSGALAYKINLARGILSTGMEAGIGQYRFLMNTLDVKDQNDPLAQNTIQPVHPELSVGTMLKTKRIALGISGKHLLSKNISAAITPDNAVYRQRNFICHYSYKIPLNKRIQLENSMLLKVVGKEVPTMADIGMEMVYREFCDAGVFVNSQKRLSISTFYKCRNLFSTGNHLVIVYAYGSRLSSDLKGYSAHEILLSVMLGPLPDKAEIQKHKKKSPPVLQH